jgi:thiol-disulfide isomerase/thioredoxin
MGPSLSRLRHLVAGGILGTLTCHAAGNTEQTLIVNTQRPTLVMTRMTPLRYYDRETITEHLKYESDAPAVTHWPPGASPQAVYGTATFSDGDRLFVIDRSAGGMFFLDVNRNGDLTDDREFHLSVEDGFLAVAIDPPVIDSPVRFALPLGASPIGLDRVFYYSDTERRGEFRLGEVNVPLVVAGRSGHYSQPHDVVFFDLNLDGNLDTSSGVSDERFEVAERNVTLAGKSFQFTVANDGSVVTLTATDPTSQVRPALDPGSLAPDYSFVDVLDGSEHGSLIGKTSTATVLYFWASWCGPCREVSPELVAFHDRYGSHGVAVIGVNQGETPDVIREYVARHAMRWPQIAQNREGDEQNELLQAYRVVSLPRLTLIDGQGRIVMHSMGVREIEELVQELLQPVESDQEAEPESGSASR